MSASTLRRKSVALSAQNPVEIFMSWINLLNLLLRGNPRSASLQFIESATALSAIKASTSFAAGLRLASEGEEMSRYRSTSPSPRESAVPLPFSPWLRLDEILHRAVWNERRSQRDGALIPSAWLSRPEAYLVDTMPGVAPAPARPHRPKTRNAAASLLAAFLCAGVAGVGSAAAQDTSECLPSVGSNSHPVFANPQYACAFDGLRQLSIDASDLNGDGSPDMIYVGSHLPGQTQWMQFYACVRINNGDGSFGPEIRYPVGNTLARSPRSVTAADFDNNGRPDLVVTLGGSWTESFNPIYGNEVGILRNLGNGTFSAVSYVSVGRGPRSAAVADLNHDGKLDIATLNYAGETQAPGNETVSILLGNGNCTFVSAVSYGYRAGNAVDDLAMMPLTAPDQYSSAYYIDSPEGLGIRSIAAVDLNGDNHVDLALGQNNASSVAVLLNNGSGGFLPANMISVGERPEGVAAGDLNGDQKIDLVTVNRLSGDISVLINNGNATFQPDVRYAANIFGLADSPFSVALVDVENDGDLDAIVGQLFRPYMSLLLNNGNGTYATERAISTMHGPSELVATDLNGDGLIDVLASDGYTSKMPPYSIAVHLNLGEGAIGDDEQSYIRGGLTTGTGDGLPNSIAAADMDGDGDLDVVTANTVTAAVTDPAESLWVMFNPGDGAFDLPVKYVAHEENGLFPDWVAAADIDGDEDPDVLVGYGDLNPNHDLLILFRNDGTGALLPRETQSLNGNPRGLVDIDHDGDLDLVLYDGFYWDPENYVRIARNDGNGTFTTDPGSFAIGKTRDDRVLAVGDLNNDGESDVVVPISDQDGVSVLINLGNGIFAPEVRLTTGDAPVAAVLADLDGDTDLDLAISHTTHAANPPTPAVSVFPNLGGGGFGPRADYFFFGLSDVDVSCQARGMVAADLDSDGDLDLAAGEVNNRLVLTLLNNGDGSFCCEQLYGVGGFPMRLVAGDFDGDGRTDLVSANHHQSNVSLLRNRFCPVIVIPGDIDGNGCVDIADLAILLGQFGCAADCGASDLDGSGGVNIADLAILLAHFGECTP